MKPTRLKGDNPDAISRAVALIKAGQLVACPTDTLYGLAANAFSYAAIDKLFQAKGRDIAKGIPILLSGKEMLPLVVEDVPGLAHELITAYWPGPLTLILPKKAGLPENLSIGITIAVRVPDNDLARRFIAASGGALAVTSANRSGQSPALTAAEALEALGDRVSVVLDGGPVHHGQASTILDCTAIPPKIIRKGPINATALGLSAPGYRIAK